MERPLETYRQKRDFASTPEPRGGARSRTSVKSARRPVHTARFVIQEHHATTVHFDFRLEHGGVLLSWVLPKGPSLDPAQKRLAIRVEDHPLQYAEFEGVIPKGQYGGGTVLVWDRGTWAPDPPVKRSSETDDRLRAGTLRFTLNGEHLRGGYTLVRTRQRSNSQRQEHWLFMKSRDEHAQSSDSTLPLSGSRSVLSGRTISELSHQNGQVTKSRRRSRARPQRASSTARASRLAGAKRASLPPSISPQLATLVEEPPGGDDWLHEIKFDGYRIMARVHQGNVKLLTRRGLNWSDRFPDIVNAIKSLQLREAWIDGEAVVLSPEGRSSFQTLQNVMRHGSRKPVTYVAFDLMYEGGFDLRECPLLERKALLQSLISRAGNSTLRFSDHLEGDGAALQQHACRLELEGIVSKRRDSPYRSGRTMSWQKCKCGRRQEFIIVGFTPPEGGRSHLGALLLACHEASGQLVYCGRVGTGFSERTLAELWKKLGRIAVDAPLMDRPAPARETRSAQWVKPQLVAEVAFAEWTDDGLLRQASFKGLRDDKSADEVVCERRGESAQTKQPHAKVPLQRPRRLEASRAANRAAIAGVNLTNPDRILYPDQGITKERLASYYDAVAEHILPHIVDRPLALVRCPRGLGNPCFFQKHYTDTLPDGIKQVNVDGEAYVMIEDRAGLMGLVQIATLEIHPWGARVDRLDRPDLLTFDLDPGPGVPWRAVIDAATMLRDRLAEIGLVTFVKTSGGKGLHVQLPIARRASWETARAFCEAAARLLVREHPDRFVATIRKSARAGRILIDYFRNNRGSTTVAPYSTRARPGAPVSCPIDWKELLPALGPADLTVDNVARRLARIKKEPYAAMSAVSQTITTQMARALKP